MTGVHNVLNGTQPDAMGEIGADGLCHFALEISPPDYVETISRYLASSVGQGGQDEVSNGPAEAVSDSGDSLFLTQKEATLDEAVRSARLRRYSRRSNPISPRDLEESEGGSSSTSHTGELKTHKWKRRKKYPLPKYSFPFLKEQKWKFRSTPLPDYNQSLHDYTIGGFFKCLGELRQSSQRGQNLESSLPTVDMDGEYISPLSEEDGERSEDEDIKVVERNHFLASSKTMSQKTWRNQLKRQKRRKDNNAGRETSGRRETEISHIQIQRAGSGGSSCRVLVQRAREVSEPVAGQAGDGPGSQRLLHGLPDHSSVTKVKQRTKEWSEGLSAETSVSVEVEETPSLSGGHRAAQTSGVLGLNGTNVIRDSSGNDNALRRVEGDIPDLKQSKKSAAGSVGHEVDGNLECDVRVEDSVSSVSCDMEDGGRKRRKGSSEDAEQLQSDAVAELRSDDAEIKKRKKKKRRKGNGEDAEQLQSGAVAEPRSDDAEILKKRRKGSGEDAEQLQSGAVAEPRSDDAELLKKRRKGSGEDAEQLQSGAVAELRSDDAEIKKKKKKKRRKGNGEDAEQLQSGAVAELRSDDAEIKKKKKKRRKGSDEDAEQLQSAAVVEPRSDDAEIKKKKKKRRKGSGEDAEQLQSAAVVEPRSDDAEIKKKKKKRRKGSDEDAEQLQSAAVVEPRSDDAEIKKKKKKRRKGSGEDAEQLQSAAVVEPRSDDAEILKKKMKKKRRKGSGEDAEQLQSAAVVEPRSDDAEIKKKKRRKGNGEDAEQLQSAAVAEPQSDDAEIKKKKKKRTKGRGEDAEQLQSGAVAEPRSDDAEIKKKKKKRRKKELGILITEEASNRTLDLPPVSTEQLEAPGNCLENVAASQLPLGSSLVKRKKCKKKQQSSNHATQDREESVDLSFCLDDSVTSAKGSGVSLKKKRKSIFEEMYVSYALKRKFENVSNQKTNEGLEDQNAELVIKKKKKNSEIFSRGVSEDKVAQSDDSVSTREKEKKRHSSFLIADAEESDAQTHGERISPSPSRVGAGDVEELNDGVTKRKKKKRKSKTSVTQDGASALPESAVAGRKKKKERTGSESEGLDSAADAGFSANNEAVVLKEKKKKCNDVIIEGPPTATTCSSVSRKKKGKCDASTETLTSVEHDLSSSETLNDTRDQKKKKKKLKNEGKSLNESAESEPRETKKKQKKERSEQPPVPSPVTPETPHILRKKHRKLKRKLLNPNEEFFTDS